MAATTGPIPYRKLSVFQDRVPGHRDNARVHLSTLIRWCTKGAKLPDGASVRLRAQRVGNRWLTTDAWFDEFIKVLTRAHGAESEHASVSLRSPSARNE